MQGQELSSASSVQPPNIDYLTKYLEKSLTLERTTPSKLLVLIDLKNSLFHIVPKAQENCLPARMSPDYKFNKEIYFMRPYGENLLKYLLAGEGDRVRVGFCMRDERSWVLNFVQKLFENKRIRDYRKKAMIHLLGEEFFTKEGLIDIDRISEEEGIKGERLVVVVSCDDYGERGIQLERFRCNEVSSKHFQVMGGVRETIQDMLKKLK